MNNSVGSVVVNSNDINQTAIRKFETCAFRSRKALIKKSCCTAGNITGYTCEKRNIFPLSYLSHCDKCTEYKA